MVALFAFDCRAADNISPGILVIKKFTWSPASEVERVLEFTSFDDHTAYLTVYEKNGKTEQVECNLIAQIVYFLNPATYPEIANKSALKPFLDKKAELEKIAATSPQAKQILAPQIQAMQGEVDAYNQGKRKLQGKWMPIEEYAKQLQSDGSPEASGSAQPAQSPSVAIEGGSTLTTTEGQTYQNATITKVEPDGVTISYDAGIVKIPFPLLSKEIREKYGYDPASGKAYAEKMAAAQQQLRQQLADRTQAFQDQAAQDAQFATIKRTVENSAFAGKLVVIQATDNGARCMVGESVGSAPSTMLDSDTRRINPRGEGFVYNIKGDEDSVWSGTLYPIGTYEYTTVLGTTRTINAYTPSFKQAMEFSLK
jgi:hypothetical protein